VIGEHEGEGSF